MSANDSADPLPHSTAPQSLPVSRDIERPVLPESAGSALRDAGHLSSLGDEFLATLSHELRTPLSAILGWTQVLRRGPNDAADLAQGLETIERNARVQIRLIEELLDMSRVTSGKLRLDMQVIDPAEFVEAAIDSARPAAEAKGIEIRKVIEAGAGPVTGDPARLRQVVANLLSNAIKFSDRGGVVEVLLRRADAAVEISVADAGAGIALEFLPLVFERFRQSDASSSRAHGGLGLGLAIARNLVNLHGGSVSALSAGEGRGATFRVLLPLSALHAASAGGRGEDPRLAASERIAFRAVDLSGTKVLAVDDDADARELIRRVLEGCSAEVFTADSAREALRIVAAERPEVVVSDLGMPGIDGFELLRRLRGVGASTGRNVPIIALSAYAHPEDRARALAAGFEAHLAKPIEPAELVSAVAGLAGRARGPG